MVLSNSIDYTNTCKHKHTHTHVRKQTEDMTCNNMICSGRTELEQARLTQWRGVGYKQKDALIGLFLEGNPLAQASHKLCTSPKQSPPEA